MAARESAAEGAGDRSSPRARTAVLRLLTAALAGGAVLLLWGGTAGARAADGPPASPPAATNDAGLLAGLLGQGGALTPVIDLVDGVTQPLTGTTPVGTTVDGVVTTVDPIVSPVVAPVTEATAPVVTPVVDAVGDLTQGVTTTLTNPATPPTVPGIPTNPTDPTTPPVIPPGTEPGVLPLPELPALLPPTTPTEPGSTTVGGRTGGVHPTTSGTGEPLPLALAAGPDGAADAVAGPASLATDGSPDATAAASPTSMARADRTAHGGGGHGPDAPGSHHHGPGAPVGPAPLPCNSGSLGGLGSGAVPGSAWLTADGLGGAGGAASTIDAPPAPQPAPAPCAGPEVSPD